MSPRILKSAETFVLILRRTSMFTGFCWPDSSFGAKYALPPVFRHFRSAAVCFLTTAQKTRRQWLSQSFKSISDAMAMKTQLQSVLFPVQMFILWLLSVVSMSSYSSYDLSEGKDHNTKTRKPWHNVVDLVNICQPLLSKLTCLLDKAFPVRSHYWLTEKCIGNRCCLIVMFSL